MAALIASVSQALLDPQTSTHLGVVAPVGGRVGGVQISAAANGPEGGAPRIRVQRPSCPDDSHSLSIR
eukprot:4542898-Pyramimonas_sp.AAC.1